MNTLDRHRKQIRDEFRNCRTLYELWRIEIGMQQEYPAWLLEKERCRRFIELTMERVMRNRRVDNG